MARLSKIDRILEKVVGDMTLDDLTIFLRYFGIMTTKDKLQIRLLEDLQGKYYDNRIKSTKSTVNKRKPRKIHKAIKSKDA